MVNQCVRGFIRQGSVSAGGLLRRACAAAQKKVSSIPGHSRFYTLTSGLPTKIGWKASRLAFFFFSFFKLEPGKYSGVRALTALWTKVKNNTKTNWKGMQSMKQVQKQHVHNCVGSQKMCSITSTNNTEGLNLLLTLTKINIFCLYWETLLTWNIVFIFLNIFSLVQTNIIS